MTVVRLHGLSDLHADDVDLCLAVLQHLLSRLKELLVLPRVLKNRTFKSAQEECVSDLRLRGVSGNDLGSTAGIDWDHVLRSLLDLQLDVQLPLQGCDSVLIGPADRAWRLGGV